jgi:acyl carrier protein
MMRTEELQDRLCSIFAETLNLDEAVSPDVDFFEMGGHSLLATRIAGRIRDELQLKVRVIQFFDNPTPRSLAVTIAADNPEIH